MNLGAAIKRTREAYGWSQQDLANKSGVRKATIGKVELSGSCFTSTLSMIAHGFSVPTHELIHLAERLDAPPPSESAQTSF